MDTSVNSVNLSAATVSAAQAANLTAQVAAKVAGQAGSASVLGGASVNVSSAMDLDKLLAQLKLEDEEKRLQMARERLASALELISAMNAQQGLAHSEAYDKISEYAAQLDSVERQIKAKEDAIKQQEKSVAAAERDVRAAERDVTAAQTAQEQAQREVAAAEQVVAAAQDAVDGLRRGEGESEADYNRRVEEANQALAAAQNTLASAQAAATAAGRTLASAQAALGTALNTLAAAEQALTALQDEKGALETQQAELTAKIDEQWSKLNDDELRLLAEVLRMDASDVQSILNKEPDEKSESQEAQMMQREDPAKIILRALKKYEDRLQDAIEAKREVMI